MLLGFFVVFLTPRTLCIKRLVFSDGITFYRQAIFIALSTFVAIFSTPVLSASVWLCHPWPLIKVVNDKSCCDDEKFISTCSRLSFSLHGIMQPPKHNIACSHTQNFSIKTVLDFIDLGDQFRSRKTWNSFATVGRKWNIGDRIPVFNNSRLYKKPKRLSEMFVGGWVIGSRMGCGLELLKNQEYYHRIGASFHVGELREQSCKRWVMEVYFRREYFAEASALRQILSLRKLKSLCRLFIMFEEAWLNMTKLACSTRGDTESKCIQSVRSGARPTLSSVEHTGGLLQLTPSSSRSHCSWKAATGYFLQFNAHASGELAACMADEHKVGDYSNPAREKNIHNLPTH